MYHPFAPFVILTAAIACGLLPVDGPGAPLLHGLLGLFAGALIRSWRALPLLALGLLVGAAVRIGHNAPWILDTPLLDSTTIRAIGKGAFGLLISYGLLSLLLAAPVAAGCWLATPRTPRTLRNYRG